MFLGGGVYIQIPPFPINPKSPFYLDNFTYSDWLDYKV